MARKQTPTCRALIPMRFQLGKEAKNMVELLNNKRNPLRIRGRFMIQYYPIEVGIFTPLR